MNPLEFVSQTTIVTENTREQVGCLLNQIEDADYEDFIRNIVSYSIDKHEELIKKDHWLKYFCEESIRKLQLGRSLAHFSVEIMKNFDNLSEENKELKENSKKKEHKIRQLLENIQILEQNKQNTHYEKRQLQNKIQSLQRENEILLAEKQNYQKENFRQLQENDQIMNLLRKNQADLSQKILGVQNKYQQSIHKIEEELIFLRKTINDLNLSISQQKESYKQTINASTQVDQDMSKNMPTLEAQADYSWLQQKIFNSHSLSHDIQDILPPHQNDQSYYNMSVDLIKDSSFAHDHLISTGQSLKSDSNSFKKYDNMCQTPKNRLSLWKSDFISSNNNKIVKNTTNIKIHNKIPIVENNEVDVLRKLRQESGTLNKIHNYLHANIVRRKLKRIR